MSAWLVIRLALALLRFAVALLAVAPTPKGPLFKISVVAPEFGQGQISAYAVGRFLAAATQRENSGRREIFSCHFDPAL